MKCYLNNKSLNFPILFLKNIHNMLDAKQALSISLLNGQASSNTFLNNCFVDVKHDEKEEKANENKEYLFTEFDSKILSSAHINFLFGAGVNGKAFPQLDGFVETVEILKEYDSEYKNFESTINKLDDEIRKKIYDSFKKEFKENEVNINYDCQTIKNISNMFISINKLIEQSENRTKTTKQVNIFTLNYDNIIENVLEHLGYLYNSVAYSNFAHHDRFFDMIGYNNKYQKFVPTYLIMKLHGNIEEPIFPGMNKYNEALQRKHFSLIFTLKEKLLRYNSVLFVIGYSGHDEHINEILSDCIANGLTIYWFKYRKDDFIPEQLKNKIIEIENKDIPIDMTQLCGEMINELWKK